MHASICDMVLDCLQNSIEADAALIVLHWVETAENLQVYISDNGCGMTPGELEKAKDPFYTDGKKHVHRKVGLGIPFLLQTVEQTGGEVDIRSEKGKGTSLTFSLNLRNVDVPPLGDLPTMLMAAFSFPGNFEFVAFRSREVQGESINYTVSKGELIDVLGDLQSVECLSLLKQYLLSQEEEVKERS